MYVYVYMMEICMCDIRGVVPREMMCVFSLSVCMYMYKCIEICMCDIRGVSPRVMMCVFSLSVYVYVCMHKHIHAYV